MKRSQTKTNLYLWAKAKERAERDGFRPGEPGYWARVRGNFEDFLYARQLGLFDDDDPRRNPCRNYPQRNSLPGPIPGRNPSEVDGRAYRDFHGVDPQRIEPKKAWVPGELVLMGEGVDVGYRAVDRSSTKGPGPYVHDFGRGVKVYRRARSGERPDKTWSRFPADLTVLGKALGFSYRDENGQVREMKGGPRKLATTPNRRVLVLVGSGGVDYLIEGGNMHVADWIRD